jgi:hypothetical protein
VVLPRIAGIAPVVGGVRARPAKSRAGPILARTLRSGSCGTVFAWLLSAGPIGRKDSPVQTAPSQTILVILTGAAVPPGLARAAVRNGWPILEGPLDPSQLRQTLARGTSGVVMVHIPVAHVAALEMIRGFRNVSRSTTVIAVGAADSEHDEILARAAGASLFIPDTADADLIESTVRSLAPPAARAQGPAFPAIRPKVATRPRAAG